MPANSAPPQVPEFTEQEFQLVAATLGERYGHPVPPEPVEVELQTNPDSPLPSPYPALYWSAHNAEFVVCKLGDKRFCTQFFYASGEQFGTGRAEYDSLDDCVVAVLQAQFDHASGRAGLASGSKPPGSDDGYSGPIVI